jgi:plastocyanin
MFALMRRASPFGLGLLVVLMSQGVAQASTKDVSIVSFAFDPATTKVSLGDAVRWTNSATIAHTSSSDGFADGQGTTGVDLWHSGSLSPNGTFTFTLDVSGTFPYHCSIHSSMRGTVKIPIKAKPSTGAVGSAFKVIWAVADPGADFEFNIQMTDANGSTFHNWKVGVTHTKLRATFMPTQPGTYMFRAQLQRISTGAKSGFSPAKSITAT